MSTVIRFCNNTYPMIYWPIQLTVCFVTDRRCACYRFITEDTEKVLHSDQTGCVIDLCAPDHKSPCLLACVLSLSPRQCDNTVHVWQAQHATPWNTPLHLHSRQIIMARIIRYPLLPSADVCVCVCTLYFKVKEPRHKYEAGCLLDLFSRWVIPTQARPILNKMAFGQQFPAGLDCIIWLFWTRNSPVSELAAAIELLLPPICTQRIEWLLQPCPRCLLAEQYSSSHMYTHTQIYRYCIYTHKGCSRNTQETQVGLQGALHHPHKEKSTHYGCHIFLFYFNTLILYICHRQSKQMS